MTYGEPSLTGEFDEVARVFVEHRAKLLAMLRRRIDPSLAQRLEAEDVLNEALLVARRKWDQFQTNGHVTAFAWLYRISRDQLFEAWRRESRDRRDLRRDMPWPEHSSIQLGLNLALGRVRGRIETALATRHIEQREPGNFQTTHQTVRGRISYSDGEVAFVIDGQLLTLQQFGKMIETFEGFEFRLDIQD